MADERRTAGDCPPQLRGRVEEIPLEEVARFYAGEDVVNWRLYLPEGWVGRIRCTCGKVDAFEVLLGTSDTAGWVRGRLGGHQRCDLRCTRCGDRFLFFDDGVHGWNAVVAGDRATFPADYLESNAKLLRPFACDCGGRLFSVIAEVGFESVDENLEGIPESLWDDAYGGFLGTARCVACGKLHEVADAETA